MVSRARVHVFAKVLEALYYGAKNIMRKIESAPVSCHKHLMYDKLIFIIKKSLTRGNSLEMLILFQTLL